MTKYFSKKSLTTFLKVLISALLLYFVLKELPFGELVSLWKSLSPVLFLLSSLLFFSSQVLSAKRLNLYLHQSGFPLEEKSNLKLYLLGMFYNFFIPGGIGGDAYKVYLLNKTFGWNIKEVTKGILCDRMSGFLAILFLIVLLLGVEFPAYAMGLVPLAFLGVFAAKYLFAWWFKKFKELFWKPFAYSLLVQLLQTLSFLLLVKSLGGESHFLSYGLLFLGSAILSLISIAGIGSREMLFMLAASYLSFKPEFSVSASLLFTVMTALFSLIGLYFQIRVLNLKLKSSDEIH